MFCEYSKLWESRLRSERLTTKEGKLKYRISVPGRGTLLYWIRGYEPSLKR